MFQVLRDKGFEIRELQHAKAILESEFPTASAELESVLSPIEIPIEELVFGGGGKTKVVQRIEERFNELEWSKHNFELKKIVDGNEIQAISHEIDHVKSFEKGILALEIMLRPLKFIKTLFNPLYH
ncbi:MAG: hypothetical protein AAGI38_13730, partial [Bacteroidota bacterium]